MLVWVFGTFHEQRDRWGSCQGGILGPVCGIAFSGKYGIDNYDLLCVGAMLNLE